MDLTVKTKIVQSQNSNTQYITVPASLVKDSQYPFSSSQNVEIRIIIGENKLEIVKIDEKKMSEK